MPPPTKDALHLDDVLTRRTRGCVGYLRLQAT